LPKNIARGEFVVRTKLRMPQSARAPIRRERLLARFAEAPSPFTLVSAPAGFGKTTLVSQIVSDRKQDGEKGHPRRRQRMARDGRRPSGSRTHFVGPA
jgi:hypothetical protein